MTWCGVQEPKATPEPIIQQVAETILEGFATPEIGERLRSFSIEPLCKATPTLPGIWPGGAGPSRRRFGRFHQREPLHS